MKLIQRLRTVWYLSGLERSQLHDILGTPKEETSHDSFTITSAQGGELIFPSPIKERFDNNEVESLADIL